MREPVENAGRREVDPWFAEARDVCRAIGRAVAEELYFRHLGSATFTPAMALPLVEPWVEGDTAVVRALALVVAEAAEARWRVLMQAGM